MEKQGVDEKKVSTPRYKPRGEHVAIFALGLVLAASLGYAWYQHRSVGQLMTARDQVAASLSQTKAEVDALSAQLKTMAASQKPVVQKTGKTAVSNLAPGAMKQRANGVSRGAVSRARAARAPVDDPRWKKMDAELAKTRSDLEGSIRSSHDELSDSIAKSHDELTGSIAKSHEDIVALQQRGERDYFEFDVSKSKQFQRTGPISVSLRKANVKHRYCDLEVRVDDDELSKKHVNLFEPIFFSPGGYSQPIELVINRIDKNRIKGYVSRPKYGQAQAAPADFSRNEATPAAGASVAKKSEPVLLTPR